jgi:osmotically-inducible protein OsmY
LPGARVSIATDLKEARPIERFTSNVETLLGQHPEFGPPGALTVQTFNGIVYLYGQVDAGLEKRNAGDIAQQAAGVTKVVNGISVPHS